MQCYLVLLRLLSWVFDKEMTFKNKITCQLSQFTNQLLTYVIYQWYSDPLRGLCFRIKSFIYSYKKKKKKAFINFKK